MKIPWLPYGQWACEKADGQLFGNEFNAECCNKQNITQVQTDHLKSWELLDNHFVCPLLAYLLWFSRALSLAWGFNGPPQHLYDAPTYRTYRTHFFWVLFLRLFWALLSKIMQHCHSCFWPQLVCISECTENWFRHQFNAWFFWTRPRWIVGSSPGQYFFRVQLIYTYMILGKYYDMYMIYNIFKSLKKHINSTYTVSQQKVQETGKQQIPYVKILNDV